MELGAHQVSLGPFETYTCHVRRTQDTELSGRPGHPQPVVPPSSLSRYPLLRDGSKGVDGSFRGPVDMSQSVTATLDMRSSSKSWLTSSKPHDPSQKEDARSIAGIVCKRAEEGLIEVMLPRHLASEQPELALQQQTKRLRASDDVDGPGTAALSCKKRRLLLHLVTSRLSRPFSLPATHILIRESGDNMPVLHRIQQLAALGVRRTAGHQGALLVRKAAILNRVRIGVRQAAVSRGHTIMADLAARGNALNHGLLLVTTPASTAFPDAPMVIQGQGFVPPVWRPHTTSFHPPIDRGLHPYYGSYDQQQQQHNYSFGVDITTRSLRRCVANANQSRELYDNDNTAHTHANHPHMYHRETTPEQLVCCSPSREHVTSSTPVSTPPPVDIASEEEDNTAFPAANFHDRYADLSDDDMDDVYADFGVLFGSGTRSPDRAAGSPIEEQFYEEYLDELDGISWVV
ncbi:hypothetical protein F5Y12DRAFT_286867 [Xylaria sp. FL1777]|nr:hypothetical protein F5Y12DRAFT_286867 [Xylaria sp. FL1777]